MDSSVSRRDFLKLAGLLPLLQVKLPDFVGKPENWRQDSTRPNFLILIFDALSAKHLQMNGYRRATTPNLNRFAEKATVFHSHYAGGNFTTPGTSSLLTGAYPWSHRAVHLQGTVLDRFTKQNIFTALGSKGYYRTGYSHNLLVTSLLNQFHEDIDSLIPTRELCLADDQLADRLYPNDYTPAFLAEWLLLRGGETRPGSLFLSLLHRFLRFDHKRGILKEYGDLFPRGIPALHNLFFVPDQAIDWIMAQLKSMPRPFLAYFHLLPPHEPYTTRKDFVDVFKDGWVPQPKPEHFFSKKNPEQLLNKNRREYDEYLAYADEEFGRLLDFMTTSGVLDDTYVIFTSDHGEMFERGIRGHVTPALSQPLAHVPLMISRPGQKQREDVYTSTSCVDLLPTIMHLTGQEVPDWCEGEILPTFGGKEPPTDREIYIIEAKSNSKFAPLTRASVALVKGQHKLTRYFGYRRNRQIVDVSELYNLANDPEEMEELYTTNPSVAAEMKEIMDLKLREVNQPFLK